MDVRSGIRCDQNAAADRSGGVHGTLRGLREKFDTIKIPHQINVQASKSAQ
jgi:hypothetical protein